jgi:hypothetical protein
LLYLQRKNFGAPQPKSSITKLRMRVFAGVQKARIHRRFVRSRGSIQKLGWLASELGHQLYI